MQSIWRTRLCYEFNPQSRLDRWFFIGDGVNFEICDDMRVREWPFVGIVVVIPNPCNFTEDQKITDWPHAWRYM